MTLHFHQEALREYEEAFVWYSERSISAPFDFVAEVDSMVKRITENPLVFPLISKNKRKAVLQTFPFYLVFELRPKAIIIFAVAHSKRKPAYWRKRTWNDGHDVV